MIASICSEIKQNTVHSGAGTYDGRGFGITSKNHLICHQLDRSESALRRT
jgi:hypothetical protein